ncbi:MAG: TetR family transcriptional regulator [Pseudomonadota bacterium]
MTTATKPVRKRRPQERAGVTQEKMLEVAVREFSERGYDAVTVRDIEVQAGVQRNLLKYHFDSKEGIWKAAAKHTFDQLEEYMSRRQELMKDLPARERVAYTIRSFARYAASHPELHRLMIQEGKKDTWRLRWIVENYVGESSKNLQQLAQNDLGIDKEDFVHWYYMFVGGVPAMFSMAPEARLLFDTDVTDDQIISRHTEMMVDLLLGRAADKTDKDDSKQ